MKQKKISYYLKGIDIVLVILVVIAAGLFTFLKFNPRVWGLEMVMTGTATLPILYLLAATAIYVLYEFWKVCTEIGKDNSFSLENAKSFNHMSLAGKTALVIFVIKIIVMIVTSKVTVIGILLTVTEIIVVEIFSILCKCLSKLIQNAYEMKNENDLTI